MASKRDNSNSGARRKSPQPTPSTPIADTRGRKGKAPEPVERAPSRSGQKRQERREQLLRVAKDVFARRGYAKTTVDDIVLEAGVARGTFYLYFGDKRDAFSELVDQFAQKINQVIVRIDPDDPKQTVVDQILLNIRGILRVCLAERALTKLLFTDAVGEPDFARKLGVFYDGVVLLLAESLRDGQAIGLVRDGEPKVLSYLTIGALKELLYQAVTLGLTEESADALSQQVYAFLVHGYLKVPRTGRAQS
jgi:AcrR family transcriptional regulator